MQKMIEEIGSRIDNKIKSFGAATGVLGLVYLVFVLVAHSVTGFTEDEKAIGRMGFLATLILFCYFALCYEIKVKK